MMTVVKADGYGHGMRAGRPRRARGGRRLARASPPSTRRWRCGRRATRAGSSAGSAVPGEDYAAAVAARRRRDGVLRRRARRDRVAAATARRARPAQGRHRPVPRRRARADWPTWSPARPLPEEERPRRVTGVWSHFAVQRRARAPRQRRPGGGLPRGPGPRRRRPGCEPEVRHLANCAAAILPPGSRFDLVRCGIASYGLDPAPGRSAQPTSAWSRP